MSQPTADGADRTGATGVGRLVAGDLPVSAAALLGALALVPTAGGLALRLLRNAPVAFPPAVRAAAPAVEALAA
ncbi:MAG: hypothetical protein ABEJ26_05230, partial [Halosimplex sp.]